MLRRLRKGEQVPVRSVTVQEIMPCPYFALGVADVRAGRGFRADYDTWGHTNNRGPTTVAGCGRRWRRDQSRSSATVRSLMKL